MPARRWSLHRRISQASLGLKLGDEITFLIFGRARLRPDCQFPGLRVAARRCEFPLRAVARGAGGLPALLFRPAQGQARVQLPALQSELSAAYPELVFLPIEEAIDAVRGLMGTVSTAISIVGGVAFASGVLVLIGALAAGRRQREADSIVAKVLGATRTDLIISFLIEYGLVGGLSAVIAVLLGVAGAWAFVSVVLESAFLLDPLLLVLVVPLALMLTIGVGAAITWSALSGRPASFLRQA